MRYQTVLFDLDGTLLDTLEDLRDAVNHVLEENGFAPRTTEEIRAFVGDGAIKLMSRALEGRLDARREEELVQDFRAWYRLHNCVRTDLYPGVGEVLARLQEQGVKLAIVTNKPHASACALGERFFPGIPVFGAGLPGMATKPDPGLVWYALEQLDADRGSAAYVGDSDVDVATAQNAGLDLVAVSWGFRDREVLERQGVERIADDARQLLEMLTEASVCR